MNILGWTKGSSSALAETKPSRALAEQSPNNEIVIHQGSGNGALIKVRSKSLMIAGQKREVDPYQLIRMIKRVTQTIGEYKSNEDVYSAMVVNGFRKVRGDLVNILENEFHIHWRIGSNGESDFYM